MLPPASSLLTTAAVNALIMYALPSDHAPSVDTTNWMLQHVSSYKIVFQSKV